MVQEHKERIKPLKQHLILQFFASLIITCAGSPPIEVFLSNPAPVIQKITPPFGGLAEPVGAWEGGGSLLFMAVPNLLFLIFFD